MDKYTISIVVGESSVQSQSIKCQVTYVNWDYIYRFMLLSMIFINCRYGLDKKK